MRVTEITRLVIRLITDRQRRMGLVSALNDSYYWDHYVRTWRREKSKEVAFLGDEWGGEDDFVLLLRNHSRPSMVALEIGCGGGRITSEAASLFKHLYASDVSKEMLQVCRQSVKSDRVSFVRLDGFTLKEFPDGSLDFVLSHDVFVHFSSLQVYSYLAEIKRVLREGGMSIVSFYSFSNHFGLFKKSSLDFWAKRIQPPGMRIHFITEEMVSAMLRDLDLDVVEMNSKRFLIVVFKKRFAQDVVWSQSNIDTEGGSPMCG